MHPLQAFILGVVEGITEFLPISSTGHLMLTEKLLHITQSEFAKSFDIVIQLGAILSVVFLYWQRLIRDKKIWMRLLVAFVPAAVIGALAYRFIKRYLLASNDVVLWSLFLGGIFLIVFELLHREKEDATSDLDAISYPQALAIGLFQCVAMIPGVSRAAATIIGGMCVGVKRKVIVEFSFLLAIPTMLAAALLDLVKSAPVFKPQDFLSLGIGFIVSFFVAIIAIKTFIAFIKRHTFIGFGIYRIAIASMFWFFLR